MPAADRQGGSRDPTLIPHDPTLIRRDPTLIPHDPTLVLVLPAPGGPAVPMIVRLAT
jgi:hypothetical protein